MQFRVRPRVLTGVLALAVAAPLAAQAPVRIKLATLAPENEEVSKGGELIGIWKF